MNHNRKSIRDIFIFIRTIKKETDLEWKSALKIMLPKFIADLSMNNAITAYQYQKLNMLIKMLDL